MKVGVIGVGSMGQNHARVYSELANLSGVYDASQIQAAKVGDRFSCPSFKNIDELLRNVDAVSICTPTSTHHEVAIRAINAGVNLLVEKPFTGDVAHAEELEQLASKQDLVIAAGFIERFNPIVSVTREAIEERQFGNVISLSTRRVSSYPSRIRDVGVIMDLGIHDVDVMRYVTQKEVVSAYALGGKHSNPVFEDHANILLRFDNGIVGFIEANWLTPLKVRRMSLTGSLSFVQVDYTDQSMEISSSTVKVENSEDMFRIPLEMDIRRVAVRKEEPLKRELMDFLNAARQGRQPTAGAGDAIANLKICQASLASIDSGNVVSIRE